MTAACLSAVAVDAKALGVDQWQQDLAALRSVILDNHPRPFTRITADDWEVRYAALAARLDGMADYEVVVAMAELAAAIGDGHTRLTLPTRHPDIGVSFTHAQTPAPAVEGLRFGRLPVVLQDFDDGVYVVEATDSARGLLGRQVVGIGGKSIDAAWQAVEPVIHAENDQFARIFVPDRLTIPEVLDYYGLALSAGSVEFEFRDAAGVTAGRRLDPIPDAPVQWHAVTDSLATRPSWLRNNDRDYWYDIIGDALYVQYNEVGYDGEHPPLPFVSGMLETAKAQDVQRAVIDLRHNFGGNAMWMLPFFRAVSRDATFDRPGGLYVLIGRNTFSAAALFVNELEQHTHALFVGEAMGSRPDTFGDARRTQLPNSGLTVRVSTIFWKNWLAGEYRESVSPHVPVPVNFSDLAAGRDPALDAALTHELPGSPVDYLGTLLTENDVNAAALFISKYLLDPRFAHDDLEASMLDLGYRFLEQGDAKNARYTFLLAETYYSRSPDVLAALGVALEALERGEEAVEVYERALQRDPSHAEALAGIERLRP